MARRSTSTETETWEPGWADTSGRHPLDQLLRKHGWEIHSRPPWGREPTWRKRISPSEWLVLAEHEALATLPKIELQNALLQEALRREGLE